jgi:HSP20 family molecular chaperone IbpA
MQQPWNSFRATQMRPPLPPAEREPGVTYRQREQPIQAMSRVFEFPAEIDTDSIRATLEHGILKIRVPKAAAGRRKVVEVARSA